MFKPHSNPLDTSFTSSLKRFKDPSSPVKITIPSRITRTFEERVIFPSLTIHPAIVPTLVILNVSSTSTVEVISSLNSGDNRVKSDVDFLFLCQLSGTHGGTYLESDDDSVRCGSQHDIAFGNLPHGFVDHVHLDFRG